MADAAAGRLRRVLDPIDRVSEILFGLIMALTFTSAVGAVTGGREEVRTLLIGAIGCNIAWGLVDGVMFLVSSLTERGHALLAIRAVQGTASPEEAYGVIARALPPVLAAVLNKDDLERMRQGLLGMSGLPSRSLNTEDWLGALGVFLLVFLSTFPVVIPFLVISDVHLALRSSNLVALVMMFACGYWLARHGGYHPWRTGLSVALLGVVLVGIAISLGG